ncbi:hypothetical protein [Vibrio navarrensis]|uniref:hypothetical protein n=1 Tax=Vibrio navarrensis TaxID=29495 RepID=UPI00051D4F91|nr:hypothetical protein [Vibrio navarrensis]KGK15316.1 hypothetical protein EA24_08205 [Vibrio navarrensis]
MNNKKIENAIEKILPFFYKLNSFESRCVLDFINAAIAQGSLCPVIEDSTVGRRCKIELDKELYDFILSLDLKSTTQKDVLEICIEQFGKERSPSRTGLNRAWRKLLMAQKTMKG